MSGLIVMLCGVLMWHTYDFSNFLLTIWWQEYSASIASPVLHYLASIMYEHEKIDYIEFPANDMDTTKVFFGKVFGWEFQDAGPDYIAFSDQGVDGGFYRSELTASVGNGSALVVFYSNDLESSESKIVASGGDIVKPTTFFPGGRRFHFEDPNGNEFAVWSNTDSEGNICP